MLSIKEIKSLKKILEKNNFSSGFKKFNYPLLENGFSDEDIIKAVEVLLTKKITMGDITKKFEIEFANFVGSKYALMVNSGSSANLLAAFAMINPQKKNRLKLGDQFLVPSLCWPTSLWPFIQAGLKPKFIDVDLNTFCINLDKITKEDLKRSRAIVNIHILGNSTDMNEIQKIKKKYNLIMLEDTCEALGSTFSGKYLGTFGDFGSFSFYYSHQITSGEGGMIICQSKQDYKIMNCLRAHGWDRGLSKKNARGFNFINSGFNLRPLDLTAAIASNQLKRLKKMISARSHNRTKIMNRLKSSKNWSNQFTFFESNKKVSPSWFGMPLLLDRKFTNKKKSFLRYLNINGVETRPILTGNFLKQPCSKLYSFDSKKISNKNTDLVDKLGFFIGLPTSKISDAKLDFLVSRLLSIK